MSSLDPTWLAEATDAELADAFRRISTVPLDGLMNAGGHRVDVATRTIFNDEHFKGWVPKDLALHDIFTRLATGYAKRFWKEGNRYLGETLYLDGRILVKHALEEFTLERPVNDLDPGKYILLRYTDPVFENLFYDVMRAADDGAILYGGYTGKFPDGRRGLTGVLMRRYSFAQMGERDHEVLAGQGAPAAKAALAGAWKMDAITTSNHAMPVATLSFAEKAGKLAALCVPASAPAVIVPSFVIEHFTTDDASTIVSEIRSIDPKTMVGTWTAGIGALYARFFSTFPGLFHRDGEKGSDRYTMRYVLTRAA